MNKLIGVISQIEGSKGISLIRIKLNEEIELTSLMIDTLDSPPQFSTGSLVKLFFKETEVMITRDFGIDISVQNKIPCVITSIHKGEILCQVTLKHHQSILKSIITRKVCDQLNLLVDENVIALLKSNELSMSYHD